MSGLVVRGHVALKVSGRLTGMALSALLVATPALATEGDPAFSPPANGVATGPKMAAPGDNATPSPAAMMPAATVQPAPIVQSPAAITQSSPPARVPDPSAPNINGSATATANTSNTVSPLVPDAPIGRPVHVSDPVVVDPAINASAGQSDEQRAKETLAAEQHQGVQLHALQKSEPNYNIIVCEAGCGDAHPHVIYRQLKSLVRSVGNDSAASAGPVTKSADCQGGCAYTPGVRQALGNGAQPKLLNDQASAWMTAVTPQDGGADEGRDPAKAAQPQASKASREDWLARLNRERAAANGQASDTH